jgi:hypothetical protein
MDICFFRMAGAFVRFASWLSTFTPSERIAAGAAALVLVGVVGEEIADIKFLKEKKRERLQNAVKRLSIGILLLGLTGDLVAIVIGQSEMQTLTREAGDAKSSAKDAADASDRANTSAGDAIEKAEEVKARVDAIRKRASDLEIGLASVQHGLTLTRDRETVLVAKRDSFESAVRPFAGQKVDVRYAANLENPNDPYDPETLWFALQLSFSLLQAQWLSPDALRDVPAEHGTGVFIFVSAKSSKTTRNAAVALAEALVAVPIEVRPALKGSGLSPGSLVSVGPLPPRIPQHETALYPPLDDETIVVEVAPHP